MGGQDRTLEKGSQESNTKNSPWKYRGGRGFLVEAQAGVWTQVFKNRQFLRGNNEDRVTCFQEEGTT